MKTIEQIREAEDARRREFEANTIGMRDKDGTTWTIAQLRNAFDRYHPASDWKNPVRALVPFDADDIVTFCRAIEFFQGDRPQVCAWKPHVLGGSLLLVTSRGYQG